MSARHWISLVGLGVVTYGSLVVSGGYVWYLRSDGYRAQCAAYVSEKLGLPTQLGAVVPRSQTVREFRDVRVWLPERRDEVFRCERVLITSEVSEDDPAAYDLELRDGWGEISTRTWLRGDYRQVVESGLRPGFDPDGPRMVHFGGMELTFARNGFRVRLGDAGGVVHFRPDEVGRATIRFEALNGYAVGEPIVLRATFSPVATGVQIDELDLRIPNLPLRVFDMPALLGSSVESGTFDGSLSYSESRVGQELRFSGHCYDVNLRELTAGYFGRPWRGFCPELELLDLRVVNGEPARLRFRGVVKRMLLEDVASLWGVSGFGGDLVLRVREADVTRAGIVRLVASGECRNVALAELTRQFGMGEMRGFGRIVIEDLTIVDNRLERLDAALHVEPPGEGQTLWVEGRLLEAGLRRALNVNLPPFLPERIEYTRFGARLDVRDEQLHVFGTHGPRERVILTVRLGEQELPLVYEPRRRFDLTPLLDRWRSRFRGLLERAVEERAGAGVDPG